MSETHDLVQRFVHARRDRAAVVVEGYHALKHALRFDADLVEVVVRDDVTQDDLPPGVPGGAPPIRHLDRDTFARLVPRVPPVAVVARATRPAVDLAALTTDGSGPLVLLQRPTHLGNLGAAVRVAAAAGADGLLATGRHDPWNPAAVRGAAGLHFAVPVAHVDTLPATNRPLVAVDPTGVALGAAAVAPEALLVFGTESRGLRPSVVEAADLVVRIPMVPKVSSLNLATSVAVVLYAHPTWNAGSPATASER